jgi:cell division transport system ATP-binding protein
MITFSGVTKKYPLGNIALKDATFEVADNDFVFLVGPSGAGKTTILKLILAELLPSQGTLKVDSIDVAGPHFKAIEALRQKIGIVFQDFKVLPEKNIFENVALSLEVMGFSKENIKTEVKKALHQAHMEGRGELFPAQLSAGELQRVAIARAIAGERKIILADEPTGNLDPKTTWEIMKIFKELEGKRTILIATHNADIVNSLQKRVLVLKGGEVVRDIKKGGYEL